MRVFQVAGEGGAVRAGVLRGGRALVLRSAHEGVSTALDLLEARGLDRDAWLAGAGAAERLDDLAWDELAAGRAGRLSLPVTPPEVWGAGVTYRRSADFREEGTGIYDRVYAAERPELFFKATASRCSAHGEPVGRRRDSAFTAAEPEVAVAIGKGGRILGFALANDVSAWDIERENPLYLPQSKVYSRCFSFGPFLVTPDEVGDPYAIALRCRVLRGGREVFSGESTTGQLKRRFEELVGWLLRSNEVPPGTVLSTGTGIIQPLGSGLEEGDEVVLTSPVLGELRNPVALV